MLQSKEYWDKRAINRLTDTEKISDEYIKRIKKIYDRAYMNIADEMRRVYINYSKETGLDIQKLKELLTKKETDKVWETLKRQGLDKYVKNNYKSRISRLEQIQAQIYANAKLIYPKEELQNTMCYKGVINDSYYKAIYDTQVGMGYDFSFSKIDKNVVTALLNERWSSKNYSQRIWGNTDILADSISKVVGGGILSGQSIEKTSKQLRDRFQCAKYYAERLVRTEANHFHNIADAMAYEEIGVDKYVFVAVLDSRTSELCQSMDNKVFEYKDKETGVNFPPLHPNCRSKTRGYLGEEVEKMLKHRARNYVTGENEIIDNISYKEWYTQYVDKESITKANYDELLNREHIIVNGKDITGKFTINENEIYEDGGINRIMEIQGYKGLPRIVTDDDFEKYCNESNFFAQRAYGGNTKAQVYDYQRQLYSSNWYIDCSVGGAQYGKGMYTAGVYDLYDIKGIKGITEEMEHYRSLAISRKSPYVIIEDITFDKSAKIIEYNDIIPTYIEKMSKIDNWNNEEMLLYNNYHGIINKKIVAYQNYIANAYTRQNATELYQEYKKYSDEAEKLRKSFTDRMNNSYKNIKGKDVGTLAVEMGYDVINAKGHGKSGSYTVILNRTKLIIRVGGNYYGQ